MDVEKNSILIKINLIILILSLLLILFLEKNLPISSINICNISNSNINHFYIAQLNVKKIRYYKNMTFLKLEPYSYKIKNKKYKCSYTGINYNIIKLNKTDYKFTFKVITYKGKKEFLIYRIEKLK